jgi:hypothetical protein
MRITDTYSRQVRYGAACALVALALALPSPALAQGDARAESRPVLGENYHAELSFTFWNPTLAGVISSEQFDIVGTHIDFVGDLGFEQTRFRDMRIVLRPAKKHRFRIQQTPVSYTADSTFSRTIVFNGIAYPLSVPVASQFDWTVWRFGYEYDFLYLPRGFVGALFEVRHTQMEATLATIGIEEFTSATAPLPALGLVGRVYVIPEVAVNFEVTGFKLPEFDENYDASYFDWDIHGTVNLTNHVGMQVGWRRMTTYLAIEQDAGDMKFQGMWFGAAVRY